jgi:hypothetical protein
MIGEINYYSDAGRSYRNNFSIGHFYIAPIAYLLETKVAYIRLDYLDKNNPQNCSYTIEPEDVNTIQSKGYTPNPELGLSENEFVFGTIYKFRPVIILSQEMPLWTDYQRLNGIGYIVAPLYSVNEKGIAKFSEDFILRVQAYKYPTLFYLPENKSLGLEESIVRFDRISVMKRDLLNPKPYQLTDDAVYCLIHWFNYFLGAELDEILKSYREAASEKIKDK